MKLAEPELLKLELTEIKQFFKKLNEVSLFSDDRFLINNNKYTQFINDEDKFTAEIYKVDVPKWIIEEHQKLSYEFIP